MAYAPTGAKGIYNAHRMYILRYYGELVRVIYGDIINSLGPIRISVSRWVQLFIDKHTSECRE